MAEQQERYFPYLEGYVALYTGDLATAESKLTEAINLPGNQRDAFMRVLLAMTYERQGRQNDAQMTYREAYDRATSHNPPGAFVRPFARAKLGLTRSPSPIPVPGFGDDAVRPGEDGNREGRSGKQDGQRRSKTVEDGQRRSRTNE